MFDYTMCGDVICAFPDCKEAMEHDHHIIYEPEVIAPLCRVHHEDITILNGMVAKKRGYKKLSNKLRWRIWYLWIMGRLKPVRNEETTAYIKEWDSSTPDFCIQPRRRGRSPFII